MIINEFKNLFQLRCEAEVDCLPNKPSVNTMVVLALLAQAFCGTDINEDNQLQIKGNLAIKLILCKIDIDRSAIYIKIFENLVEKYVIGETNER